MEKGEERLNDYVNADYIWNVIMEHHKILKKLNKTDIPLRDQVYDYVINIDSEEEEKSKDNRKAVPDVSSNMVSVTDIEQHDFELESLGFDRNKSSHRRGNLERNLV